MGCVSMSRSYFDDGRLGSKQMDQAEIAARLELRPVRATFSSAGWRKARLFRDHPLYSISGSCSRLV